MSIKTPCIGICSTSSLGDRVCRGCKRYAFEVVAWNSYDAAAKAAVMDRIEKLVVQIMANKFRLLSPRHLQSALQRAQVPYDTALSPWCWLHNLLSRQHAEIGDLRSCGACPLPEFSHLTPTQLLQQVERELLILCEAHLERYYPQPLADIDRAGR